MSLILTGNTSNITIDSTSGITFPNATLQTVAAQTGPAFSAYANTTQTVTLATNTKIAIDTEFFDTNSCFDTTLNRFTPTVAGYYQINGVLRGTVATTFTGIAIFMFKNGALFRRNGEINGTLTAGQGTQVLVSEVVYFNGTTDYLELYGQLNGTGTATFVSANSISCPAFSACLVRVA
jgi:hypothetical protein